MIVTCQCGKQHKNIKVFPVRCRCGHTTPAPADYVPPKIKPRPKTLAPPRVKRDCGCGKESPVTHIHLPQETIPAPKSNRLVIVVVANKIAADQYEITGPAIRQYAEKCNADFRAIEGDVCPDWSMGNKWRISQYVKNYEQTLYLDVDVVIRDNAPNIFDNTPKDKIALYDEYRDTIDNVPNDWIQDDSDMISDLMGWEKSKRTWSANGGVMVLPRWAADLYRPPTKPFLKNWCIDQALLTQQLDRLDIQPHLLDHRWNHIFVGQDFWSKIHNAYFIHLNGSRPHSFRLDLLRRLVAGDYTPVAPPPHADWRPQWAR